jgi:hypothetical protein
MGFRDVDNMSKAEVSIAMALADIDQMEKSAVLAEATKHLEKAEQFVKLHFERTNPKPTDELRQT